MENVSIRCMKSTDSFMNQSILEISFSYTGYHHVFGDHMVWGRCTRSSRRGKLTLSMNLDSSIYISFTTKCSVETTFKVANFVEKKYQKIFLQDITYRGYFPYKNKVNAHSSTLPWTTNPVTQWQTIRAWAI